MTINATYLASDLDRAMANNIAGHTGIPETDILKSIIISKEHARLVRQRAILAGRLCASGFPEGVEA